MRADAAADLDRFPGWWVESGEVTAVFAAVATPAGTVWSRGASRSGDPVPGPGSLFDAASLTKPWIATLALRLDGSGALALATPVGEVWPGCERRLARRTLEDLLRHRAGFMPWTPLYRRCRSRDAAERLLLSGAVSGAARGGEAAYSDLDYILWGFAAERRLGADLETLLRTRLVAPLGLAGLEAAPGDRADVVASHCDNAQEVALAAKQGRRVARRAPPARGEPQDGNARFLGGLCGHAGLFVAAGAMLALGGGWLDALEGEERLVGAAAARRALAGSGAYALGWARRRVAGTAGRALPPAAFGHVGFTGTSLWIDPSRRAVYVLLAHRSAAAGSIGAARRRFHALAAAHLDALGPARTEPASRATLQGKEAPARRRRGC